MTRTYSVTNMALCAFLAALTAVFSQILIPLPFTPIPVNLATLAVFLTGGLLGPKWGPASMMVYIMLGAFGLPVFTQMRGGPAVLVSPTGGYLLGYVLCAAFLGFSIHFFGNKIRDRFPLLFLLVFSSTILYYVPGTLWYLFLNIADTEIGFIAALFACVIPFIPGDLLKAIAAAWLIQRLTPHLDQYLGKRF